MSPYARAAILAAVFLAPPAVAQVRPAAVPEVRAAAAEAAKPPTPRPASSPNYSAAFANEVKVNESLSRPPSRAAQNRDANRTLYSTLKSDAKWAEQMNKQYPGLSERLTPGPRGGMTSKAPIDSHTWHHLPEFGKKPGTMQMELVPRTHHEAPGAVQKSLHPNNRGGYAQMKDAFKK